MTQKKWHGDHTKCDLCANQFMDIPWFADAKVLFNGRRCWALVCPECHAKYTSGTFGLGIGQKYDASTKVKIEG